jgi:hypothetical protein
MRTWAEDLLNAVSLFCYTIRQQRVYTYFQEFFWLRIYISRGTHAGKLFYAPVRLLVLDSAWFNVREEG